MMCVMKYGDIVTVFDGSYSLSFHNSEQLWGADCVTSRYVAGCQLASHRWRVLASDCVLPAGNTCSSEVKHNSVILCRADKPEYILFTQPRFCRVVSSPTTGPFVVTLPAGVSEFTVRIREK